MQGPVQRPGAGPYWGRFFAAFTSWMRFSLGLEWLSR